jgi:hypothetical protein
MVSARVGTRPGALCAAALMGMVVVSTSRLAVAEPAAVRRVATTPSTATTTATKNILELRNLMSEPEFRAAGLQKLSAQEMVRLNDWVGRMVVRLIKDRKQAGCGQPIESRVSGEFEGWDGNTVVELQNGQIWKQRDRVYKYTYKISPKAIVYQSGDGCHMKVDGADQEILVERLK